MFVSGFYRQSAKAGVSEFNDLFFHTYNENPSLWEASGYDAAMLLQNLMNDQSRGALRDLLTSQQRRRSALREALLASGDYAGLTGTVSFRPDGSARRTIYTLTVQAGRIVELTPTTGAPAE